jgi:hypothetical protein
MPQVLWWWAGRRRRTVSVKARREALEKAEERS